jgi:hypothetical protein
MGISMTFSHTEKRLLEVLPVDFTADGTQTGVITLSSTCDFKVKQNVTIEATGEPLLNLEVKRVLSKTQLVVGPLKKPIHHFQDMSNYTLAKSPTIRAHEQIRPTIPEQEIERLTYEEEPTIARRVVVVDRYGDKISDDNPLPVDLQGADFDVSLKVQLEHKDNTPDPGDRHDATRIGDGTNQLEISQTYTAADDGTKTIDGSPEVPKGSINVYDHGYSDNTRTKNRLMCSHDLSKTLTWAEIDGVRRIAQIVFTSVSLDNNLGLAHSLTRTFIYQGADPFDLITVQDVLTVV